MGTRSEVADKVRIQAGWCRTGSPLYESLLTRAADDIEAGGPSWDVMSVLADAKLEAAPALRLMGSVHRLVLEDRVPELARFYPSVGGRADGTAAWPVFRDTLASHGDEIRSLLTNPVQTNEAGRAASLVGGFLTVAGETGLPLRTLEIGASGGLLSRWDHYQYEARGLRWGDPSSPLNLCSFNSERPLPFDVDAKVAERAGCDQHPVDVMTEEGRLTLKSFIWADQVERIRLFKQACSVAQQVPITVDKAGAVQWIEPRIEEPAAGVATTVFHSIVMQYLTDEDRTRFEELLRAAGDRATDDEPLAWLRMEAADDKEAHVHLTMWPGGKEKLVATTGYHGQDVRWLGW